MDGVYTSLSSNTITFQAGTYKIYATAVANFVQRTQLRLYDTTNSATLLTGDSSTSSSAGFVVVLGLSGVVTFASATAVQLQHNSQQTRSTDGMGLYVTGFTTDMNVYALVDIIKIA